MLDNFPFHLIATNLDYFATFVKTTKLSIHPVKIIITASVFIWQAKVSECLRGRISNSFDFSDKTATPVAISN